MQIKKVLIVFSYIAVFFACAAFSETPVHNTEDPLFYYHKGVSAKTIHERTVAFEKALELYLSLYNDLESKGKMNGMLCYNIGNCYFNLKQIGYAIYYYKTGLKLLPGNETITENLKIALDKRLEPMDVETSAVVETLLFFHYKISAGDRIRLLIIFSWITAVLLLALLIRKKTALKYLSGISFAVMLLFSISVIVEYYRPDHQGVMIQTANVRKDAGEGFAPITPVAPGEGTLVKVLGMDNDWYRIKIAGNRTGYIQKEFLKLIL